MQYKRKRHMETRRETKIAPRKITLLVTEWDDDNDMFDGFKDFCEINGYEVRGTRSEMEGLYLGGRITYFEWKAREINDDIDEFWRNLKMVKDSSYIDYYVVTGSLGLWNGRHSICAKTFNNLYDAVNACATDAMDMEVTCDGKVIEVTSHHHDGTNCFEIRRLTWVDCNKIERWDDEKDGDMETFIVKHAQEITYEMVGL